VSETQRRQPEVLAMILCDQVIRDQITGKMSVIGSFSAINAVEFPTVHRNMAVYVALTEGEGEYDGSLRFGLEETGEVLLNINGKVRMRQPLDVAEWHFHIAALPLPRPGKYRFDFFCDDVLLKSRWFLAQHAPKPEGRPEGK